MADSPVYRIAVVGTGIAGLSAAWRLGAAHRVTLYERAPSLGMAVHGWQVESPPVKVDVPIRVMYAEYYPVLLGLLAEAGVPTRPLDGAAAFADFDDGTYFRYRNLRLGTWSLPMPWAKSLFSAEGRRLVADYSRLSREAQDPSAFEGLTLGEYLARNGYSSEFVERLLLPVYATLCTCTYEQARAFPASIILEYLGKGLNTRSIRKAVGGADAVVKAFSSRAADVLCNAEVSSIRRLPHGVEVVDPIHGSRVYDHVVVATQSNHALDLVDDLSSTEREVLSAFTYTPIEVVMHQDTRLMPKERRAWSPANYVVSPSWDRPMTTLWVNTVYRSLRGEPALLQTVHPAVEPESGSVLSVARLQRPVVTLDTQQALSRLGQLHDEPERRLWFCGSYALAGIPLLESATGSAVRVATRIASSRVPIAAAEAVVAGV